MGVLVAEATRTPSVVFEEAGADRRVAESQRLLNCAEKKWRQTSPCRAVS